MKTIKLSLVVAGICTLLSTSKDAAAQQEPLFTQYMQAPGIFNPAYAGSQEALSITTLSRLQWTGFDGAPRVNAINIHSPISDKNLGLGLTVINDKLGPVNQTSFYGDVSYKLVVSNEASLRLGLRAGGTLFNATLSELRVDDQTDPNFQGNINSQFLPSFGFGAYFNTKSFFAGVSTPNFLSNEVGLDGVSSGRAYKQNIHLYSMIGGLIDISPSVLFKPTVSVRYVGNAPLAVDVNANVLLFDRVWLGAMYRLKSTLGGMVQFIITDQFKVGYSYDRSTDIIQTVNNGTHEIMLNYNFNYGGSRIKSPRYF